LGALALAVVPGLGASEAQATYVPPANHVAIQLLNINDFHGRINTNTVQFAGVIEELRADVGAANTLVLSAGDNVGASLFASAVADDKPTLDVLNALDVKASALGNHEFDKGLDHQVNTTQAWANFRYLGANVYSTVTNAPVFQEYEIFYIQGIRVAVIGVVTPETPTLVSPGGVAGLEFREEVAEVNRVAAKLRAANSADVIVAEYHDGSPDGVDSGATLAEEVAKSATFARIVNVTSADVDVIFTGHTHKLYAWDGPVPGVDGKTRPIIQTGSYGTNVGRVVMNVNLSTKGINVVTKGTVAVPTPDAKDIEAANDAIASQYPRAAEVQEIVKAALDNANEVGAEPLGKITASITTAFIDGAFVDGTFAGSTRDNRAEASSLGTMVANALRDTLRVLPAGADFGVVNPGGLRADLVYSGDGTVTFAQAKSVLPFDNTLGTVSLTGAQVITMLEQQWQRNADGNLPTRPYLQLGLSDEVTYTYTEAPDKCTAEATNSVGGHDEVDCTKGTITSVTIAGEPIDKAKTYKIATFSFLAQGGDNFWVFQDASEMVDTGMMDWEGFADYLKKASPISPSFARSGVRVEGVAGPAVAGQPFTFAVSKLDVPALGAPANTTLEAFLGSTKLGEFPVADGAADVTVTLPESAVGSPVLTLEAPASGTVVTLPIEVVAAADVPTLELSLDTIQAGKEFDVVITDGPADSDVRIELHSDISVLATGSTDGSGNYSARVTVPANTTPGDHEIWAIVGGVTVRAPLTVTAAGAGAGGGSGTAGGSGNAQGSLPVSGSNGIVPTCILALGCLAIGAALVRRRQSV
jgi:5'-nucleotidase